MRLLSIAILAAVILEAQDPEALKDELPRLRPTEAPDALKTFRLQKGLRLELVAAEPLIASPVDMVFDEDGRLYVIEMVDYPFGEKEGNTPHGRVRLLEDTHGDGRFDKSTVFADRLAWPTSLALWDGGVFVAAAPHLYYFKDTNGDGTADVREIVFTGFGNEKAWGLLNNLKWGLDNWIYGASGGNGGLIRSIRKPGASAVSVGGRDFRFRPTGEFEALSGGGQFGNTLDDFGRRFVCNNSVPAFHVVLEDRYLSRNPQLPISTVTHLIASDGAAGTVYPASPPEPWRVARTRLRVAGQAPGPIEHGGQVTGYFTAATGITVYRGTALGPRYAGSLFVGDVAGNLVHRKSLTPAGATFRADRVDAKSEFLASTDNWFRPVNFANGPDGALYVCDMYREVIEAPHSIPEAIRPHLDFTSGKDRGRIWRVIAEGTPPRERPRLGKASAMELVEALKRPDAWWRETAARLLFQRQDKGAAAALENLAGEAPLAETRAAALWVLEGLGAFKPEVAEAALLDPCPAVREQAVRLARPEALFSLEDEDARVRLEVAFRMGETEDPRAVETLARLSPGADAWLRAAILSSTRGPSTPLGASRSVDLLRKLRSDEIAYTLALTIGARNDAAEVAAALELAKGSVAILRGLGDGLSRAGRSMADLPGASALFQNAARTALDEKEEVSRRVDAIRILGYGVFGEAERCLPQFLEARRPQPLQASALRSLVSFRDPKVGGLLSESWKGLSPALRREALVWFSHPDRAAFFLDAVEGERISRSEAGLDLRRALLSHKEQGVRERARRFLGDDALGDRQKVVETYHAVIDKRGDRERGQLVYRKNCAGCHRAEGEGKEVGPDLATVKSRSREELLGDILDPNREVQPLYVSYKILTTGGQVLDGLIASESSTSVTLKRAQGESETVLRVNIERMVTAGASLMPEGLEKGITVDEMADLIEFIRRIGENGK